MERVARDGRLTGRLAIGGWHVDTTMGGRGGKSVGAGRGAGGGAVRSC